VVAAGKHRNATAGAGNYNSLLLVVDHTVLHMEEEGSDDSLRNQGAVGHSFQGGHLLVGHLGTAKVDDPLELVSDVDLWAEIVLEMTSCQPCQTSFTLLPSRSVAVVPRNSPVVTKRKRKMRSREMRKMLQQPISLSLSP
jgi:hypothetical protein